MFAVLHVADFALQAVLRTRPGASACPAALFDDTRKKSVALAVNAAARAAGVEPGMTAPQAVARCPALLIRTPRPAAEAEARAALLAIGSTLSPRIEDTAPGVCTIDLKGAELRQTASSVSAAIAELARLDLPATAGIARTPLLALYGARHHLSLSSFSPRSSGSPPHSGERTREEKAKEERSSILPITDEAAFLAPLPLSAADPSPELAGIFSSWGLRTLRDFTALPRDEIVRRFGREGLAFWRRATGGEPRPLTPVVPPQEYFAAMDFDEPVETLEPLLFILRRFLERLALELGAAQYVAGELALTLQLENEQSHARSFRLPEPTGDVEILFRALHSHLESLHTDSPIAGVQLRAVPARPLVRQQGLFETGLRDPHGFAETLARVTAIAGNDRVGTPQREDTHRPDAVKLVAPAAVIPPPASPAVHPPVGVPLRRFRPPLPATVELARGGGLPAYVLTDRFRGAIAEIRGPWLSSGDWWQADRVWCRTEYDIALAGGGLYRLLQLGDAWYIEGEYD
jgi:protein ImuB